MKKLLEAMEQNEELKAKVEKLDSNPQSEREDYIKLAAEYGVELKEEDLKPQEARGELTDGELDAVAGGASCICVLGGGGEDTNQFEKTCACVLAGAGEYGGYARDQFDSNARCYCAIGGSGDAGHL